jgi:hypothetical protein
MEGEEKRSIIIGRSTQKLVWRRVFLYLSLEGVW